MDKGEELDLIFFDANGISEEGTKFLEMIRSYKAHVIQVLLQNSQDILSSRKDSIQVIWKIWWKQEMVQSNLGFKQTMRISINFIISKTDNDAK